MMFNSGVNSLYKDAKFLCGIPDSDTTTYPIDPDFTRNSNIALDRVVSLIVKWDGSFPWDDSNKSDLPIGEIDITANANFPLPAALRILRIRIKDSNGNYITVEHLERRSWTQTQLRQESGTPRNYAFIGQTLTFDKTFNYTASAGIEVQYQRTPVYFVVGDTTAEPGFDATFHRLISLYAALEYCEPNELESRAKYIRNKIGSPPDTDKGIKGWGLEGALCEHYSRRSEDQRVSFKLRSEDYGELGMHTNMSAHPFRALD